MRKFGVRGIAVFAMLCVALKLGLSFLPEQAVLASLCRVPAEVAAFYYGVPLNPETLSFTAKGVTLSVMRPCAAMDFFILVASALLTPRILREDCGVSRFRGMPECLLAWVITLAVNSLRIIALVPVDAFFPKDHAPVVHMLAGVAFFLPAFAGVWWWMYGRNPALGNHAETQSRRDEDKEEPR